MYGLRMRTYSLSLGTYYDYMIPDEDMPDDKNDRGNEVFRDVIRAGDNTYVYDKAKIIKWNMSFVDVSTETKDALDFIANGFFKNRAVTMVYFGTAVNGTATPYSLATTGQLWGTCLVEMTRPKESAFELWNFDLTITKYGTSQVF